jgi:hypothetical protein
VGDPEGQTASGSRCEIARSIDPAPKAWQRIDIDTNNGNFLRRVLRPILTLSS